MLLQYKHISFAVYYIIMYIISTTDDCRTIARCDISEILCYVLIQSARSQLRKLSAGRSRGSAGFRLPSVKVAVRKKSGKRCNICGKKTRLTNGFQCRCCII